MLASFMSITLSFLVSPFERQLQPAALDDQMQSFNDIMYENYVWRWHRAIQFQAGTWAVILWIINMLDLDRGVYGKNPGLQRKW